MNYYKVSFPTTMTDQETELLQPLTSQRAEDMKVVYMVLLLPYGWRGHCNPGLDIFHYTSVSDRLLL